MLQPKIRKHRKEFRGKMGGIASANNTITFGEYGLKSMECGWIKSREIESARKAITSSIKRKGKVWIKIFPHKPYTQKGTNSKMIAGKGEVEGYVAVVNPGTVLFEVSGVPREAAMEAMRLASHKLSVKTKFISKREI
ncbi:50S ribosomal protein L16 [candidate division WS6 bacterium RIFOXYD1_FULL_33_8]|uniref:Large ribosomal subunit protein uL16 n=2 Tax=Candidatus Dojkabacteria TaxID=74243 RepID=A0A0G0ATB3_9BACT|nr:ribosomal protein L16 [uncultured bacterium]KKP42855.1 MAG: 50S ribosomal protein L16, large subunit ribosomal protein L16 [candidate division WS6 bacterium GW2011_GWE2_33_157]KKP44559.1 MAG: 50S ribosomal protein L16, large subunit ribosomal protein L16 [candidate division WS6 bacterium GW2011_GWC1_33_20]KKP46131.1 MAG: 50S ribosomal protein L16, large subunit ribosomal protein L16 [candidate division WS6 bacterium GW2011_GWF1_33_233]KKP54656.1 MAG: 50S ribosomal protein L16 [candidate divi